VCLKFLLLETLVFDIYQLLVAHLVIEELLGTPPTLMESRRILLIRDGIILRGYDARLVHGRNMIVGREVRGIALVVMMVC
jgi:hypothetical protein